MLEPFRQLAQQILLFWRHYISSQVSGLFALLAILGLITATLSVGIFIAISDVILDQQTLEIDTQILLAIQRIHTPNLDRLMVLVTYLGDPWVLVLFALGLGLILLWRKRRLEAITLIVASGGASGLNTWLKAIFARSRPALWEQILHVKFYSFPSGHAMVSFVVYAMLAYGLAARFRHQQLPIALFGISLIAAIGFSRLYIGVHWPTDVVAGYAAGLVWLITCRLGFDMGRFFISRRQLLS
ncbi:MAG: phosphatase PAP2 family protein [Acaryochloris sp. RU_4_1]|nr:phosphatase PAP2 family protein [Acaryochloris sp. RU_4_1]NJR54317.1 phosphatase PAP2 family protein [Acaryochloris sp. CRU_2_0]